MQRSSFVAGMVVGIALTVSSMWLLRQPTQHATDSSVNLPDIATTAGTLAESYIEEQVPLQGRSTTTQDAPGMDPALGSDSAENVIHDIPNDPGTVQATVRQNQIPTPEPHQRLLDQYADTEPGTTSPTNRRSDLEDEPRDHEWSYFMEQSISQYLATHPEVIYFEIHGVECRSTICEIQSIAVDENAWPRWGLILHDLRNQPWNDFGQTGSSSSNIDGRLVIMTHLRREKTPE